MDNDTYDDRTSRLRDEVCKENDQVNIKFLKQQEFNANIVKRLEELEDYLNRPKLLDDQVNIKLMKQDERIEALEEQVRLLEQYTVKGLTDNLRDLQYDIDTKLERIDDILVVHRNQTDNQRKNFHELRKVLDDKVMDLLEKGEHGKE